MGNVESKEDDGDYLHIPDESWTEGMVEVDEGAVEVDEADAVAFIEQLDEEFLQLDEVVQLMQEEEDEQEQSGRHSHGREKDMWGTVWGTMLKNPDLNDPKHWVHRNFVRRFRLPYQLFKQVSMLFLLFLKLHLTFQFSSISSSWSSARRSISSNRRGKVRFR
jgi:hypothetical protein